jgi:hypothetical protein
MVIVKIIGGLGNQMFQYAAGLALAKRTNQKLKLDISSFEKYKLRNFDLNFFRGYFEIASSSELDYFRSKTNSKFFYFCSKLSERFFLKSSKVYGESFFHFDPNFLSLQGSIYLTGYWQSEKYFENVKETIVLLEELIQEDGDFYYQSSW